MFVVSYSPLGYEGILIRVEADIRRGIPGVDISGLAAGAVREARDRVRAAFRNSGFNFPNDRILINLAPAGIKKDGAGLDLPIALAVMAAAGSAPSAHNTMVLGELELSGRIRPVRGVLAAAAAGLDAGVTDFIVPAENAIEAAILAGVRVTGVSTLEDAVQALEIREKTGFLPKTTFKNAEAPSIGNDQYCGDFADVRGQSRYKRTLEIAAAGGHNLLVFGPPGAGKTMLARRMPSIMAKLTEKEAVTVTRLHSLAGLFVEDSGVLGGKSGSLITQPPFRSPHHSASAEGILGGGKMVRPGEISLAHLGVLFLDEAPEFKINVLQSLREPMEDRVITISRAEGTVRLPACFQLLLAANPCPCGKLGIRNKSRAESGCFCSVEEVHRYWRKFGAALLDRVELRTAVSTSKNQGISGAGEEKSAAVAKRVLRAVEIQRDRFKNFDGSYRNACMSSGMAEKFCALNDAAQNTLSSAAEKLAFSGRAYHSILRVARTIADLECCGSIEKEHVLEAVEFRRTGDDPYDIFSA